MDSTTYSRKVDEVVKLLVSGFPGVAAARFNRLDASLPTVATATIESAVKSAAFQQVGPQIDKIWTRFSLARQAIAAKAA